MGQLINKFSKSIHRGSRALSIMEEIRGFAEERLKGDRVSGPDHSERVYRWCEVLARAEGGGDLEILRAASLLHDVAVPIVGRARHYEEGARIAREFLAGKGIPRDRVEAIAHAIEAHSRFGGPEPKTLEAKILYDADLLDFIGAIGIVRAIGRGLLSGEFDGDVGKAPEFLRGVFERYATKLHTKKAQEIARGRLDFMREFVERLREELALER